MQADVKTTPNEADISKEPIKPVGSGMGASFVGPIGTILLIAYLFLLTLFLLYCIIQLWPSPTPAGGAVPSVSPVILFVWTLTVSDEVRLLLLVALIGALGGILHALRSVYWYIGNRLLVVSWVAMYIMLPLTGTALALIFYLVIRGGFFSPQASVQQTSPFGFAAMAALVGMFSPQAVLKLKQVAETVLTKPPDGADSRPQDQA